MTDAVNLEPQTLFADRYRVVTQRSERVYEVVDESRREPRALKLLAGRTPEELTADAERIADAAALSHPNLVRTFRYESAPVPHFTMEWIRGTTWQEFFDRLPADAGTRASWIEATSGQVLDLFLFLERCRLESYDPIRADNILISGGAVKYFGATRARPTERVEPLVLELARLIKQYRSAVPR